jgi:catechol 2,3-dioxygenase-like lactoylglutathione lyase family enzyme
MAVQTCFVVPDVEAAVQICEERYGWGPFLCFSVPSPAEGPDAGTDVALGNAGRIQVELVATRNLHNAMATYQQRHGHGFQHLGILCEDVDESGRALEQLGARVCERGSHPGIRYAFVDVPTGEGMLELLQPDRDVPTPPASQRPDAEVRAIESATIVTRDLAAALAFFEGAFGWDARPIEEDVLEIDGVEAGSIKRASGQSGALRIELVEPVTGDNPYARHLEERAHGLVHVSARDTVGSANPDAACTGRWRNDGSTFRLLSGPLGRYGLRLDLGRS